MTTPANINDSADIETIVRLVVERLRAQMKLNGNSPHSVTSKTIKANAPDSTKPETAVLRIAERVITTELLRGRLSGIAELHVSKRAVVTPAVIDELKDHRVKLLRVEPNSNESKDVPAPGTVRIVSEASDACRATSETLGRLLDCRDIRMLNGAADQMTQQVFPSDQTKLVIVTDSPHQTLWHVHQFKKRAVFCRAVSDVVEAANELQANILIIDARCGLSTDLVDAIRQSLETTT